MFQCRIRIRIIDMICIVFSCVGLLDRFLQQCMSSSTGGSGFVTQKNLQLIAVAAFLIAAKVEVSPLQMFLSNLNEAYFRFKQKSFET